MRSALMFILVVSFGFTVAGDAKGTLNYKGKSKDFAVTLKFAYLVKGPDEIDPKTTIRRVILSATDLTAKIQACKTMDCSDDDLSEGIEVDITGGPRLNYWLAVNNGLVQYSGTQRPTALVATTDTPTRLAGKITFDDSAAGGAKLDATFDATLLKTFDKAR
ncbi:MAG TPA: hypothetical protein VLT86_02990 [Vicinamibacterales bacterium]|nr:hypothetical protein [Vicinamibacterales bacterium]